MEKVSIARVRGGDIRAAVHWAVALVGGIEKYVRRGDRVLIKPNLVRGLDWRSGGITNPWVMEALVELARQAGAGQVIIGEGPAVGGDSPQVFQATGYADLAARLGVDLVDLNSAPSVVVRIPRGVALKSISVARLALEVDALINVPVMKTHNQTIVTLALKNMKGVLSPEGKRKDHFVGLDQAIADMSTVLPETLVVVDGVIGMEGHGPGIGDPVELGLVLAAANPVAADATAARIMGFAPEAINHLVFSAAHGLGPVDGIEVVGERLEDVRRPFVPAPTELSQEYGAIDVVERDTCSGCWGALVGTLERMRRGGDLAELQQGRGGIKLCMGRHAQPPADGDGWILFGLCQRKHRHRGLYVPGCPPEPPVVRDQLRALVGLPALSSFTDEFIAEEESVFAGVDKCASTP